MDELAAFDLFWSWARDFFNSNFSSAMFGAIAGALTADRFARWSKRQDEQTDEQRAINNAIITAGNILSSAAVFKEDMVLPLVANYQCEQARHGALELGDVFDLSIDAVRDLPLRSSSR